MYYSQEIFLPIDTPLPGGKRNSAWAFLVALVTPSLARLGLTYMWILIGGANACLAKRFTSTASLQDSDHITSLFIISSISELTSFAVAYIVLYLTSCFQWS